jgi:uncharacterized peroxidase-related enzyme
LSRWRAGLKVCAMSQFTIHSHESAPQASQDALAALEKNIGFIPNLAGTIAGSPAALQSFVSMQSALRGSSLTPVEREVVGLTVSRANSCEYSMAAHSTFAVAHGAATDVVVALRAGDELPDARLEALRVFTSELLSEHGHVPAARVDAFLQAGYSDANVLEVVTQVAYTTFANLVANLADTPVDEPFEPQAWTASRSSPNAHAISDRG